MGKPSMFSKNYEQQIKQRKINTILVVLIAISGCFFIGKYYADKYKIKLFNFKIPQITSNEKTKPKQTETKPKQSQPSSSNEATNTQKPADLTYDYTSSSGAVYKVHYTNDNGNITMTSVESSSGEVNNDISSDKKYIVFDDTKVGSVIVCGSDGKFKTLELTSYTSKSAGITIEKSKIMASSPWFVWAAKPHFTSDGKIVYVSHLPYVYQGVELTLWITDPDGSENRMIGKLSTSDSSKVSYNDFDSDGRLIIKSDSDTFYLTPQNYNLTH